VNGLLNSNLSQILDDAYYLKYKSKYLILKRHNKNWLKQ
jgi:hypothetical protein